MAYLNRRDVHGRIQEVVTEPLPATDQYVPCFGTVVDSFLDCYGLPTTFVVDLYTAYLQSNTKEELAGRMAKHSLTLHEAEWLFMWIDLPEGGPLRRRAFAVDRPPRK